MNKGVTYISGAISNKDPKIQEENLAKFFVYEEELRKQGYEFIYNPARNTQKDWTYSQVMTFDVMVVEMLCERIAMMNNWKESKGARKELGKAMEKGLDIIYQE